MTHLDMSLRDQNIFKRVDILDQERRTHYEFATGIDINLAAERALRNLKNLRRDLDTLLPAGEVS